MAYDVFGMLEAVNGVVAATWTDVLGANDGGGIHLISEIERRAFDDVTDPAAGGAFPFAVVDLEPAGAGNFGVTNADLLAILNFYYVTKEALTDQVVWDKLEALKQPLFTLTHAGLNVLELTAQNVHPSNPILNFFLMRAVPYSAGLIGFQINYGESAV